MFLSDKIKWHLARISENWADPVPQKRVIYVGKRRVRGLCELWAFRWNINWKTRLLAFIKELMVPFIGQKFFLQSVALSPFHQTLYLNYQITGRWSNYHLLMCMPSYTDTVDTIFCYRLLLSVVKQSPCCIPINTEFPKCVNSVGIPWERKLLNKSKLLDSIILMGIKQQNVCQWANNLPQLKYG